jgi:hypothetical protein
MLLPRLYPESRLTTLIISIVLIILAIFSSTASLAVELTIIDSKKSGVYGGMYKCAGLGDINGDGYGDFLLGLWISNELQLYLGGPRPFDNPPAIVWPNLGSLSGLSPFTPVNVGDVDCDGVNDFIAVFSGDDTLKLFLGMENLDAEDYLVLYADSQKSWINLYIDGGGDNNCDGRNDFWMLKHYITDTLYGYWGCDFLDTAYDHRIIPSINPDNKYRGISALCTTCDLNGDSIPDIIYGQVPNTTPYLGRVCIVWGGADISEEPDLVFYSPGFPQGEQFGMGIACLHDISGDGIDDLWVTQAVYNYIYHGGIQFDTIYDFSMQYSYMFGNLVENIGDINSDGYNDVQLGYNGDLFSYVSYIYCYPEMDSIVDVAFSDGDFYTALYDGPVNNLGYDMSWCGDINGDSIDDALITAETIASDVGWQGRAYIQSGWHEPTAAEDENTGRPSPQYELRQNYPNPFNSGTVIEFTLPQAAYTELKIYNLAGEVVAIPIQRILQAGFHQVRWDGVDQKGHATATGIYLYHITSGEYSETRKMILLK